MASSVDELFRRAASAMQTGQLDVAERSFRQVLRAHPKHVPALNLFSILLVQLKRFDEAAHYARLALAENAASDASFFNYGLILKALNKPAEAAEQFGNALKLNATIAETWYHRALVFNDLKRHREAIADLDRALAINPNFAEALAGKGRALAELGSYRQSLAAYDRSLALKPTLAEASLGRGNVLTELDRHDEALAAFDRALALKGDLAEAWLGRGNVFLKLDKRAEALGSYERALALKPDLAEAWLGRGNACALSNKYQDAAAAYDRALALRPGMPRAWLGHGNVLSALGQYASALTAYDEALELEPGLAEAWLARGNALAALNQHDDAFAAYDKALALNPDLAEAWLGRGNVFVAVAKQDAALAAYDKALALKPGLAEAWLGRGNAFLKLKRHDDALAAYDKALALKPDLAEAWVARGHALGERKRYDDAFGAYGRALALKPGLAEAWLGRGNVFAGLNQFADAAAAYDNALALKPDLAEAWLGRGNIAIKLNDFVRAEADYEKALALKPDLAEAWLGRGRARFELKRYSEALAAYSKAVALKPDLNYAAGARLDLKLLLCDWTDFEADVARLVQAIREGKPACAPFTMLTASASAEDQLRCARRYVEDQPSFAPLWRGEAYAHDRIRVAYLSADFQDGPVACLLVGLFEQHDRSRFETTAISFGPEQNSAMRERLRVAFEHFRDVQRDSDQEIAELIRRLEIDIVVDLMGFTRNARPSVLARRPAPVQVNYLGYSGTMGAGYIDYILGDAVIIPADQRKFYAEQVVWLPHCYLANDDGREISQATPTRRACGLPETGFVFCCFNNTFKITPDVFDVWMALLQAADGSVLWLRDADAVSTANLRRRAEQRGVAPHRLVFAPRTELVADHLARHRLADLFLDTSPYNAHTTASDALWSGLPVLTCLGTTFAGRAAASLLRAIGLDELITRSLADYQAAALKLVNESGLLAAVKAKLARNRDATPLFDTELSARDFESAYLTMVDIARRGGAPRGFSVETRFENARSAQRTDHSVP